MTIRLSENKFRSKGTLDTIFNRFAINKCFIRKTEMQWFEKMGASWSKIRKRGKIVQNFRIWCHNLFVSEWVVKWSRSMCKSNTLYDWSPIGISSVNACTLLSVDGNASHKVFHFGLTLQSRRHPPYPTEHNFSLVYS